MQMIFSTRVRICGLLILLISVVFSCTSRFKSNEGEEGYELAKIKCSSCHQFPEAELLNRQTWAEHVLPKMSSYFGLGYFGNNRYYENDVDEVTISPEEWNKILLYYLTESPPDSLEKNKIITINQSNEHFTEEPMPGSSGNSATTYIGYHEQNIIFANGAAEKLFFFDKALEFIDSVTVDRGVSSIAYKGDSMLILSMGVLYPSDAPAGTLKLFIRPSKTSSTILDSLQRPVFHTLADLNKDGFEDIIICEFGDVTGQLSWFENDSNRSFTKHTLRALPGATKVVVNDFNKDNLPDVMAMMAQGDEGIFIYYNLGNKNFREQRILEFSPSFGSNYFEVVDFNDDGAPDILATNGDNGDYPAILKPYHGVRLYLNDGRSNFKEAIFLPLNGACKARAVDFDKDGDLDIAAISYFPDYANNPGESFVYFKNNGHLDFSAFTISQVNTGRWLTMESADIDSDGDTDILLGNAPFALGNVPDELKERWKRNVPPMLLLRNNTVKR